MEFNTYLFTTLMISGAVGGALFFVGWLFVALTALGNKKYVIGFATLIFFPAGLIHCYQYYHVNKHAANLYLGGLALLLVSLGGVYLHLSP